MFMGALLRDTALKREVLEEARLHSKLLSFVAMSTTVAMEGTSTGAIELSGKNAFNPKTSY